MRYSVRDNAIPERLLHAVRADWPADDWSGWHAYADGKRGSRSIETAPPSIRRALELLAETTELFPPDAFPDLSFYGAGLHEIPAGRGLGWHHDAAKRALRPWRRSETAILYLDELGDLVFRGSSSARVTPAPGRSVVFLPDAGDEHRFEPAATRRRSLSVFFYVFDPSVEGPEQSEFSA